MQTSSLPKVPFYLAPLFWAYAYGLAYLIHGLLLLVRLTCRVEVRGREGLSGHDNVILATWHESNFAVALADVYRTLGGRWVIMGRPAWYMAHVEIGFRLLGVERLAKGMTGHGGRRAADEVVEDLRRGASTFINPDGPSPGPPRALRKGALHMAVQSGVPVVALTVRASREMVLRRTWDKKRIPLPFSVITVTLGRPLAVAPETFEDRRRQLVEDLG